MIGLKRQHTAETFTAADVDTLTNYVKSNGLAGLHFWSLDRDTPCATTTTYASPHLQLGFRHDSTGIHQPVS